MPPKILNGKIVSEMIKKNLFTRVKKLGKVYGGEVPTLATILVGDDPASQTYVEMKARDCARVGMKSKKIFLPKKTKTEELVKIIQRLNKNRDVHGILLQHPTPKHINERVCFDAISYEKDVDGVTSLGFGRMSLGEKSYGSATPEGIMRLIDFYGIKLEGKNAVVVGRSPILGKPMAMMLLNRNATVTVCHSKTDNLPKITKMADIVVGAMGKPNFIRAEWIKKGAILIDAGWHPKEKCGDIDLEKALKKSSAYTPVPGGVGPMTIATLLMHTVDAFEKSRRK